MWAIILKWVWENLFWLMPVVLYAAYWLRYQIKKKPLHTGDYDNLVSDLLDPVGREAAMERIGAPKRWHGFYRNALDGMLAFFNRWFGKGCWNPRAFQICYLVAFMYPLLFSFVVWMFTGEEKIGILGVFPPSVGWMRRLWWGGLFIGGMAFLSYLAIRLSEDKREDLPFGFLSLIAFAFISVVGFINILSVTSDKLFFNVSIDNILANVFATPLVAAFAISFVGAFSILSLLSIDALVPIIVFSCAGALLNRGEAFSRGLVLSIVVGMLCGFLLRVYFSKVSRAFWFFPMYIFLITILVLIFISFFDDPKTIAFGGKTRGLEEGMMAWVGLLFLPTLNTLFDFASLQLSRWFLAQIKEHDRYRNIGWIVADILAAIVLLMLLYGTIFLCLDAVDSRLFPAAELFPVDRWRELFWEQKDWLHPEILWLTLMASTTLIVTAIHLVFVFAHLFVPLWHLRDREKITGLIQMIREKADTHPEKKPSEADCRRLATAYYVPWERGIVLGTLTLWMAGYLLYGFVISG